MADAPPAQLYTERLSGRQQVLRRADALADRLGNLRLLLALVTLILIILPLFIREGWPWWCLIPMAIAFVALGKWQDKAFDKRRRAAASVRFYSEGLDRLQERWRTLGDDGEDLGRTLGSTCIYAGDLDLFGPASLFQLLARASTAIGRRTLARFLVEPAEAREIAERQGAVVDLTDKLDFREELVSSAAGDDASFVDDQKLLDWAEKSPAIAARRFLEVAGIALPVLLAAAVIYVAYGGYRPVLVVAIVVQVAAAFLSRRITEDRANALAGPDRALARYAQMIEAIEGAPITSPRCEALRSRLLSGQGEGGRASAEIRGLHSLVNLLDARLNVFFALTLGPALLWDLNLILRAERFRLTTGKKLRGWLETIGELEALASLASLGFERPDYAMPAIVDGDARFSSQALAHPLIDRTRVVANDLELGGPGFVLLLSGSNMSGKSTLLRSVGINVVLARAGAPVAARKLEVSIMRMVTSVRIVDSLAAGTSHFYAEINRLKAIVDAAKQDQRGRVLYLLDEMLHGTNSRERYIGAVSVIKWLSEHGAMGIVTTHDLALAKIESELPSGRAKNMHFSDEVSDGEIRFDYRLREGPVTSTNALRLMRRVGIDIVEG
jgi:hypothetical protein